MHISEDEIVISPREKEKEEWIFGFHTTVQKWKKID